MIFSSWYKRPVCRAREVRQKEKREKESSLHSGNFNKDEGRVFRVDFWMNRRDSSTSKMFILLRTRNADKIED